MKELVIEAKTENLNQIFEFIDNQLEEMSCSAKTQMQIDIAIEEIFVNISNYAYYPGTGFVTIRVEFEMKPVSIIITCIDQGTPYDPLAKEEPDITLTADQRPIGGLGIFMVKKSMDQVSYKYKDNSNVLTLKKGLH